MGMLHRSLGAECRHLGMKGFQATSETTHSLILASSSQCVRSMAFLGLISEYYAPRFSVLVATYFRARYEHDRFCNQWLRQNASANRIPTTLVLCDVA